jgi:hypothetical protein
MHTQLDRTAKPDYTAPCHLASTDSEASICLERIQALADKLTSAFNEHHKLEVSQGKADVDWQTFYAAYLLQNGVSI